MEILGRESSVRLARNKDCFKQTKSKTFTFQTTIKLLEGSTTKWPIHKVDISQGLSATTVLRKKKKRYPCWQELKELALFRGACEMHKWHHFKSF
ncbi:hypothetical protein BgiBS90_002650, partial [Biomphalaria glabrata]